MCEGDHIETERRPAASHGDGSNGTVKQPERPSRVWRRFVQRGGQLVEIGTVQRETR